MTRRSASISLLGLLLTQAATAADLREAPSGGLRATCEDLATFCFAEACGGDQIAAAQKCQVQCPSATIISVVPAACRKPVPHGESVLRRRG